MLVKKNIKINSWKIAALLCFVLVAAFFIAPNISYAQQGFSEEFTGAVELGTTDIRVIIARIINIALGLLGVIAVSVIIYGGFIWMTAGGTEEKINKAKSILINGAIGLAIILSSYGIARFVINALQGATGVDVGEVVTTGRDGGGGRFGTLGYGIIRDHYPTRNARGIARNTKIAVSFKEPMDVSTIINNNETPDDISDDLTGDNIKIFKSSDSKDQGPFVVAQAVVSDDQRTFIFTPQDNLGSAVENTTYTVYLTDGIQKAEGGIGSLDAFGSRDECEGATGYCWSFEVSTIIDNTPPQVTGVIPLHTLNSSNATPRNSIVQINFSEAIDPLSVNANNINILSGEENSPDAQSGTYNISNQYEVVEFIPDELCGTNSCGGDVFCLPGNERLQATIKAASLSSEPPLASFPYTGIVDMAGNSLDGGGLNGETKNRQAEGSPADDFVWQFYTSDEIDLEPPEIKQITHTTQMGTKSSNLPVGLVDFDAPILIEWSKMMMTGTLNNENITLQSNNEDWYGWFNFFSSGFSQKEDPLEQCVNDNACTDTNYSICYRGACAQKVNYTLTNLNHSRFFEEADYISSVSGQVKDIYQNCFTGIGPQPSGL